MSDLLFQARELKYLVRGPRAYARRRTPAVRKVFGAALRLAHPVTATRRRVMAQGLPASPFTISDRTGVLRVPEFGGGCIGSAVQEARAIADDLDLDGMRAKDPTRHLHAVSLAGRIGQGSAVLRLALATELVRAIADYIGTLPVLQDIMLLYSPNERMVQGTSQYYHLDGQDVRTLQLFVHLTEVTDDSGPLTAVSAEVSETIARQIRYRKNETEKRVSDEIVDGVLSQAEDRFVLTGPAGTANLIDTDRCFHYGSRQGTRPRLMLVIQYYSPFAFVLPRRWSKELPFAGLSTDGRFTEAERLVLGAC